MEIILANYNLHLTKNLMKFEVVRFAQVKCLVLWLVKWRYGVDLRTCRRDIQVKGEVQVIRGD